eukprot:474617-Hanusia_phi.AAC.2
MTEMRLLVDSWIITRYNRGTAGGRGGRAADSRGSRIRSDPGSNPWPPGDPCDEALARSSH